MLSREWNRPSREADDPAGTHIPFTAPLLSGVCVRINRSSLDFLLPNPSGGRGTYVVGWPAVAEYAAPTLHDTILAGRIAELGELQPAKMRSTAHAVALEGYAGRLAADAAARGNSRTETARLRLWSQMLMSLVGASSLSEAERTNLLQGLGKAGPGVMTAGLNTMARRLDWEPATLFDGLSRLSASHVPLLRGGRVSILLSALDGMQAEVARELNRLHVDGQSPVGGAARSAGHDGKQPLPSSLRRLLPDLEECLRHGRAVVDAALRTLDDPVALLDCWRVDPAIPLSVMTGVERALDGWDRIALLWQDCVSPSARAAILPEIGLLLRLAADRVRTDDPPHISARQVGANRGPADQAAAVKAADLPSARLGVEQQWSAPPATAATLVERNERIRARELDLEHADG